MFKSRLRSNTSLTKAEYDQETAEIEAAADVKDDDVEEYDDEDAGHEMSRGGRDNRGMYDDCEGDDENEYGNRRGSRNGCSDDGDDNEEEEEEEDAVEDEEDEGEAGEEMEKENKGLWNDRTTAVLVAAVLEERRSPAGMNASNGCLKKASWQAVTKAVAEELDGTEPKGKPYNAKQMQSKIGSLKKDYGIVRAIHENNSGWGNNPESEFGCTNNVAMAYVTAHPEAKKFLHIKFVYYEALHEIYGCVCCFIFTTMDSYLTLLFILGAPSQQASTQ